MRCVFRIGLLVGSLLCGLACGSDLPDPVAADSEQVAVPPPRPADGPALFAGEEIEVEIRVRGIPAGQLVVRAGSWCRAGHRDALPVRAVGRSTGLVAAFRDVSLDATSLIERRSGLALQTRTHKKVRRPRLTEVELGEDRCWWRRTRPGKPPVTGEQALPPSTYDALSLVALLRSWRPAVSPQAQVHVLLERRVWQVQLMYRGAEMMDTSAGERPAVRIDGVAQKLKRDLQPSRAKGRAFSLWIADDRNRTPLRFVVETRQGELLADLAEYVRGRRTDDRSRPLTGGPATAERPCAPVAAVRAAALRDAADRDQSRRTPADRDRLPFELKPFGR